MGASASIVEPIDNLNGSQHSISIRDDSVSEWKVKVSVNQAREQYEADGTLPKNCPRGQLELRALLAEPVSQPIIGNYAKRHQGIEYLLCWIDIQEFRAIESGPYRLSKALYIFEKYIDESSKLNVHVSEDDQVMLKESLQLAKTDKKMPISNQFYNETQRFCFENIYLKIFVFFKKTEDYVAMSKLLKESYNFVRTEDFEYVRKLGQGGFGIVVQVMKKSTKQHYAMKIQTKRGLLSCFPEDPWRCDYERQALSVSLHPFIVNLEYAFQTDSLAIMVLGLGTAGDLRQALRNSPGKVLSVERVQFYAAEIILALCHLHSMGLIYRDLKPNNVLLNADGHIQLVDLGAVTDIDGITLGLENEADDLAPVFAKVVEPPKLGLKNADGTDAESPAEGGGEAKAEGEEVAKTAKTESGDGATEGKEDDKEKQEKQEEEKVKENSVSEKVVIKSHAIPRSGQADAAGGGAGASSDANAAEKGGASKESVGGNGVVHASTVRRKRAMTIIGTYGYMAPEMVVLLSQDSREKRGYTQTVDWWSLGATIYKLLTNEKPFADFSLKKLIEVAPMYKGDMKFVSRYAILFQKIPEHANVNPVVMDLISKLLDVNHKTRLGSSREGGNEVKAHPFFENMNWEKLELKLVEPPFFPQTKIKPPSSSSMYTQYASFGDMMSGLGKEAWIADVPKWNQQRYFSKWDYTSPQTLKLECDVADAMHQYDQSMVANKPIIGMNAYGFVADDDPERRNGQGKGIIGAIFGGCMGGGGVDVAAPRAPSRHESGKGGGGDQSISQHSNISNNTNMGVVRGIR